MKKTDVIVENGKVAGNCYDKYGTRNPIARHLMKGFLTSFRSLVEASGALDIHEVGCGEGCLSTVLARQNRIISASDVSPRVIEKARKKAEDNNLNIKFKVASIYDLTSQKDSAQLVVCCEVLEHLDYPERGLRVLAKLASPYLLVSVPREPVWSMMNLARLKYVARFGNTPGHLQQWSKPGFLKLLSCYFDIVKVLSPIPWTMVLCRSRGVGGVLN